jgi:hypothetical protein
MSIEDAVVGAAIAKADAAKKYPPISAAQAGARSNLAAVGDTQFWVATSTFRIAITERNRRSLTIVNRSATAQNLMVALGTIDQTTTPTEGFVSVPQGGYFTTTDVKPVFAYYVSTADFVQVRKEVLS